ncbi:MAG: hypothetical protein PHC66_00520 [Candidatus Nanoarchaeia archaeon]|nr:hypothetical protein [Candidatus Nanoarchaeia archaeon]MDD5239570.1 hypothetical protein [Candidatus Nanoarchaeia archaeon]
MEIDLFKLQDYSRDIKARGWIVCKGKNVKTELNIMIKSLKEKGISQYKLFRLIEKELHVSNSNAQRMAYLKKEWFPLIFIEYLIKLTNGSKNKFQENIEFLKINNSVAKPVKAVKGLNTELCKVMGAHAADGTVHDNFFRISDGYKSNLIAFKSWIENIFETRVGSIKQISENEWAISFHNKVITRYITQIFNFPNGEKVYTVREPEIIKKSRFRNAFAIGALSFEAGVGIKNQVELCVVSKQFRDDLFEILNLCGLKITLMNKPSGSYWRFWSNKLSKDEAKIWLNFFEPKTEKWYKLYDYVYGFQTCINNEKDAICILNNIFKNGSGNKICIEDVFNAIKELKECCRYELVNRIITSKNLKSYGGKWAHSIAHYLKIFEQANIIIVTKGKFGKKKSFGSIIRQVYTFNPNISDWKLPYRPNLN